MNQKDNVEDFSYFNVVMKNERTDRRPIEASYKVTSQTPILRNIEDYKISVVRWVIPQNNFLFLYNPNQSLNVSFQGASGNHTFPVDIYNSSQDYPSPYGNAYPCVSSYEMFTRLVNQSLSDAFADLKTESTVWAQTRAPEIVWDYSQQKFFIQVESNWVDGTTAPFLYFNNNLYNKISNLYAHYYPLWDRAVGDYDLDWHIFLTTNYGNNPVNASGLYQIYQQSGALSAINSMKYIQVQTQLPIVSEFIPTTTQYSGNNVTLDASSKILTDFAVQYDNQNEAMTFKDNNIYYNATNINNRSASFTRSGNLDSFQINLVWLDENLTPFPVMIEYGQSFSIKVAFRKKKIIKQLK